MVAMPHRLHLLQAVALGKPGSLRDVRAGPGELPC